MGAHMRTKIGQGGTVNLRLNASEKERQLVAEWVAATTLTELHLYNG